MASLELHLNGAATGEGFVIVSSAQQPLPATFSLRATDGGDADVTLRAGQGGAATLTITPATVRLSGQPVEVQVTATTASGSQNDTTIEVVQGDAVVAQFALTAIEQPRVEFRGRFQCRLATDPDPWFHLWGENSSFGMYAVSSADVLPPDQPPDEPPLDRIIRFQDGVALRPLCDPIGVEVSAVVATVGGAQARFKAGDPLLGLPVRLGPDCKFDGRNRTFAPDGREPIASFRLAIEPVFAGESAPALPRQPGQPHPSTAPYADGIRSMDDAGSWKPEDFGYPEATWADHGPALVAKKLSDLEAAGPAPDASAERIRQRRIKEHKDTRPGHGMDALATPLQIMERYTGQIDREQLFAPNATGVLAFLRGLPTIQFIAEFFDFDTDCQTGSVGGTLGPVEPVMALAGEPVPEVGGRVAPGFPGE